MQNFGEYLRVQRKLKGLSGKECAELLGITESSYLSRERGGGHAFTRSEAERLAVKLGVPKRDVLDVLEATLARKHGQTDDHEPERRRAPAGELLDGDDHRDVPPEWIDVDGKSMEPILDDGDQVRIQPVRFVSELTQGGLVLVELNGRKGRGRGLFQWFGRADGTFSLRKSNTRYAKEDFEGTREDVAAMYRVVEIKRGR